MQLILKWSNQQKNVKKICEKIHTLKRSFCKVDLFKHKCTVKLPSWKYYFSLKASELHCSLSTLS